VLYARFVESARVDPSAPTSTGFDTDVRMNPCVALSDSVSFAKSCVAYLDFFFPTCGPSQKHVLIYLLPYRRRWGRGCTDKAGWGDSMKHARNHPGANGRMPLAEIMVQDAL